jgi:hypothetical protein
MPQPHKKDNSESVRGRQGNFLTEPGGITWCYPLGPGRTGEGPLDRKGGTLESYYPKGPVMCSSVCGFLAVPLRWMTDRLIQQMTSGLTTKVRTKQQAIRRDKKATDRVGEEPGQLGERRKWYMNLIKGGMWVPYLGSYTAFLVCISCAIMSN